MVLETLIRNLLKGKTGRVTIDVCGAKVTVTNGETLVIHNVEFSPEYVDEILREYASTIFGVEENRIVVSTQQSYDSVIGYTCEVKV